jgi:hypothetical protein
MKGVVLVVIVVTPVLVIAVVLTGIGPVRSIVVVMVVAWWM